MPEPTPEERERLVEVITNPLKNPPPSREEVLHGRVHSAQLNVLSKLKEVARARGYIEDAPLQRLAAKTFLDELCHYDKDELIYLCSVMLAMQTVEMLHR